MLGQPSQLGVLGFSITGLTAATVLPVANSSFQACQSDHHCILQILRFWLWLHIALPLVRCYLIPVHWLFSFFGMGSRCLAVITPWKFSAWLLVKRVTANQVVWCLHFLLLVNIDLTTVGGQDGIILEDLVVDLLPLRPPRILVDSLIFCKLGRFTSFLTGVRLWGSWTTVTSF